MGFGSFISDIGSSIGSVFGGGGGGSSSSSGGGTGGTGGNAEQSQNQNIDISNEIEFNQDKLAAANIEAANIEAAASLGSSRFLSDAQIEAAEIRAEAEQSKARATVTAANIYGSYDLIAAEAENNKAAAQIKAAEIKANTNGFTLSVITDLAKSAGKGAAVLTVGAGMIYLYTHKRKGA